MKQTHKLTALLLSAFMLLGATACTNTGSGDTATTEGAASTSPETAVTDTTTEKETEAETDTADFEVTVGDTSANVVTPTGLAYTVEGYDSIDTETGAVTFTTGLTVTFAEGLFEKFNRFTMAYASDKPLKVSYSPGSQSDDPYFLEAGEGEFSGLIYGFLEGQLRRKLTALHLDSCTGEPATFTLSDMAIEILEVPDETYFLENERFKLGIALHWGGAISYLEDKTCTVEGLSNLVNRHDTGRLIQQSYYGTGVIEGVYDPGSSFGVSWKYNPVQGGDQYGNGGRLIDLVIKENSVYIKSQPCDWALEASFTPFYTENTYTVEEDHIRVDNRAVDFMGVEHPYEGQELPAMYLVSYLDTFVCYTGDKSWTGDTLSVFPDLDFWGTRGTAIAYFKKGHTETWGAWISSDDNFGIGLYMPGTDSLGGGRYEPDIRDKSDVGDSTSVVGAGGTLQLQSFQAIEYSYLLTTGRAEEIRETFSTHKDFTDNAALRQRMLDTYLPTEESKLCHMDFSDGWHRSLVIPTNSTIEHDTKEQALLLTVGNNTDAFITLYYGIAGFGLQTEDYSTLKIEYMLPTTNSAATYSSEIYPCAGENTNVDAKLLLWQGNFLVADGQYHTAEVDLSASSYWLGEIHKIRFDFFNGCAPGDIIYIKSITLE